MPILPLPGVGFNTEGSSGNVVQNFPVFVFTPCCGGPTITLKTNGVPLVSGSTYLYDSLGQQNPSNGLLDDFCYTVFSEIINNESEFNSLLNTPQISFFTNYGVGGCSNPKCEECEDYPITKTFRFRRCCDPNDIVLYNMFEYTAEPIVEGVYYYTGNFINSECYILEEVEGPALETVHTYITFSELQLQIDCNTTLCRETCPPPECYTLVNCFEDISINVQFVPGTVVNNNETVSINLIPGSVINQTVTEYFMCGLFVLTELAGNTAIQIDQITPSVQLYNNRPFYTVPYIYNGVERINYIIWSGVRWELWKNFNIFTGPDCIDCLCNEPYTSLNYGTAGPANLQAPQVGILDPVSQFTSTFVDLGCHNGSVTPGTPTGFRNLDFCEGVLTTILPDNNCWKISTCTIDTEIVISNTFITEELSYTIDPASLLGAGLTREEIVGNYLIDPVNFNPFPLILNFINVINAVDSVNYTWEITHNSYFFSDVEITDNTVQYPELVKTGGSVEEFGLIRIKLTATDLEGCVTELIILSIAIA